MAIPNKMYDLMYKYIKEKTPKLSKVLDIGIKNYDDDDSAAYIEYIVTCLVQVNDFTHTTTTFKDIEQKCLVNIIEFERWQRKEEAIKWI